MNDWYEKNPLKELDEWIEGSLNYYLVKSDRSTNTMMNDCLDRQIKLGEIMAEFLKDIKFLKQTVIAARNAMAEMEDRNQRALAVVKSVDDRVEKMATWLKDREQKRSKKDGHSAMENNAVDAGTNQ